MTYDLVTFGEAMIRLSPPGYQRIEQTGSLDVHVGGTELNVAVSASRLGLKTAWVSKLPENPLGRMIRNKAREQGVDTSHILWEEDGRAGLYFIEFGATPRASTVLYDRADSSFSRMVPGEIDWKEVLSETACFHVTGISPAVSPAAREVTLEALRIAKNLGCTVSFDLNYRKTLWSEEDARKTVVPMMAHVDVLIASMGDSRAMLGVAEASEEELAQTLLDRFPLEVVALTVREGASVLKVRWHALARTKDALFTTREFVVDIIDQVGRGDAFAAGFLAGYLPDRNTQRALDYGIAASALKHSIPGDMNWCTLAEVEALLAGPPPGVSR